MAQPDRSAASVAWTFETRTPVEHVALTPAASWAVVADSDRGVHVLDESGSARAEIQVGQAVRRLRASARGDVFTALAAEGIVYALNRSGDLEWRVELGGPAIDFDFDPDAALLAAVSGDGAVYFYSADSRERLVAAVGWPATSVGVVSSQPLRVAVCDDRGHVAALDRDGTVRWETDLGCRTGGLSVAGGADLLAVAADRQGAVLVRLSGERAGTLRVGEPVLRCEVSVNGSLAMLETAADRLVLVDRESSVLWETSFHGPVAAWALGARGRLAAVGHGPGGVTAYATGVGPIAPASHDGPPPEVLEEAQAAEAPSVGESDVPDDSQSVWDDLVDAEDDISGWSDILKVDSLMDGRPSRADGHSDADGDIVWTQELPSQAAPPEQSSFLLNADGSFLVVLLADGRAVVLNAAGQVVVQAQVTLPAAVTPQTVEGVVGLWNADQIVMLELATGSVRTVSFGDRPALHLACSSDMGLWCAMGEGGRLQAFRRWEGPVWQKDVPGEPDALLVSPGGDTVLVTDRDGRFRYYDAAGRLTRKIRISDEAKHRPLALGDGFTVLASSTRGLTVLDGEGRELWSQHVFSEVAGLEVLGGTLALYGPGSACAAVNVTDGAVWRMDPPAGSVRLRKPPGSDPALVHASGSAVTLFQGYQLKLDAVWRHTCDGPVIALDADRDARTVAALVGRSACRLEARRAF
ncbi:MAG: outer membrane protein assembly factor BamB family protein [Planctomycetota bacterium]